MRDEAEERWGQFIEDNYPFLESPSVPTEETDTIQPVRLEQINDAEVEMIREMPVELANSVWARMFAELEGDPNRGALLLNKEDLAALAVCVKYYLALSDCPTAEYELLARLLTGIQTVKRVLEDDSSSPPD